MLVFLAGPAGVANFPTLPTLPPLGRRCRGSMTAPCFLCGCVCGGVSDKDGFGQVRSSVPSLQ